MRIKLYTDKQIDSNFTIDFANWLIESKRDLMYFARRNFRNCIKPIKQDLKDYMTKINNPFIIEFKPKTCKYEYILDIDLYLLNLLKKHKF